MFSYVNPRFAELLHEGQDIINNSQKSGLASIIQNSRPLLIFLAARRRNVLYVTSQAFNQLSIEEESMKRKMLSGSVLLLLVALIPFGGTPQAAGQSNADKDYEERLVTVLNPAISTMMAERIPLSPRLSTLEGKTIYMVDMQWGGPEGRLEVNL
jgi:hypothetical protein